MTDTTLATTPQPTTAGTIFSRMNAPAMRATIASALTGYMDAATFAAHCFLAAKDPKLAACSADSLLTAFLACAQMGLSPSPAQQHVALVPRKGEVVPTPQWQGFKFIMERQPGIRRVRPVLVHALDAFRVSAGVPVHEFDPLDDARVFAHPLDAGKDGCQLRGGYLVIEYSDGRETDYHYVSAAKIHRNREIAETQKLWRQWFEEMALKTILRDAWAKRAVSIDPEIAERIGAADDADNRALGNDPARVSVPRLASGTQTGDPASILDRIARASSLGDLAAMASECAALPMPAREDALTAWTARRDTLRKPAPVAAPVEPEPARSAAHERMIDMLDRRGDDVPPDYGDASEPPADATTRDLTPAELDAAPTWAATCETRRAHLRGVWADRSPHGVRESVNAHASETWADAYRLDAEAVCAERGDSLARVMALPRPAKGGAK